MDTNNNIFMPLGSNDDSNADWTGTGLVAFKLFLGLLMLRGASVHTIMTLALAGGLIALVVSIILKATAGPSTLAGDGYHVERDQGGQTWVQFDEKPPRAVRDALKQQLGARRDRRRQAWHIRRRVSARAVAQVIERANRAQVPCARGQVPLSAPAPGPLVSGPPDAGLLRRAAPASPTPFSAPPLDGAEERQAQEALAHLERLEQQRRETWANAG
jgi:hypothetical protein